MMENKATGRQPADPAVRLRSWASGSSYHGRDANRTAPGLAPGGHLTAEELPRVRLFGLDMVDAESLDPVVEQLLQNPSVDGDELPLVLTPNVDILVGLAKNQDQPEAELFRRAKYCLPDGQPVVLVSQLLGRRLRTRLAGSDLFVDLWPKIVDLQVPVVVVASSERVANMLQIENPNGEILVAPMFDADDPAAVAALAESVLQSCEKVRPQMVLVGIGHPRDARVIAAMFDRWPPSMGERPLAMGLGGSFSLYLGLTRRAPEFLQRMSLEWFFRFCQEPRRLFRRYFIQDLAFIPLVIQEWWHLRRQR